jgi:hypothetical protein
LLSAREPSPTRGCLDLKLETFLDSHPEAIFKAMAPMKTMKARKAMKAMKSMKAMKAMKTKAAPADEVGRLCRLRSAP